MTRKMLHKVHSMSQISGENFCKILKKKLFQLPEKIMDGNISWETEEKKITDEFF